MSRYSLPSLLIGNRRCQSEWESEERAGLALHGLAWFVSLFHTQPCSTGSKYGLTAKEVISFSGNVKGVCGCAKLSLLTKEL